MNIPDFMAGAIEPRAPLLKVPADRQKLYKIMRAEHLIQSAAGKCLHFNRVDSYRDLALADPQDGEQLPADRPDNAAIKFAKDPAFSIADYYDRDRSRTYACCFSLENTAHIWAEYGNGSPVGKACVVFDFAKLRSRLNATLANPALDAGGARCTQIFSIDYGLVEYVDRGTHRANEGRMPNPKTYAFMKDRRYADDRELRVTLSAMGIGHYAVGGKLMEFPDTLTLEFDFGLAIGDGTIIGIEYAPESASAFIRSELAKLNIEARARAGTS